MAPRSDADVQQVQIVLDADDKHLRFRSSVALRRVGTHEIAPTMATPVSCRNWPGRAYMGCMHHAHHHDVMPTMLRAAVGRVLHAEPLTSQAWPA
nr:MULTISPECIES: DUF2867 domain-containing protein [unclassified Xanthomonas]